MSVLKIEREIRILGEDWGTAEFWGVSIDGIAIATRARPFTASDSDLVLSECEYCYHCGMPEIAVRRTSDGHVIWFVDLDEDRKSTIGRDVILEFDKVQYEECIGGDTKQLGEISKQDLELVLSRLELPKWEDALYTIPDLPNDTFGKNTIRKITDAISENRVIPHTDGCANPSPLRIGLDVDKIPETVLLIAYEKDETVFSFGELPHLPIWMKFCDEPHPFTKLHANSEIAD